MDAVDVDEYGMHQAPALDEIGLIVRSELATARAMLFGMCDILARGDYVGDESLRRAGFAVSRGLIKKLDGLDAALSVWREMFGQSRFYEFNDREMAMIREALQRSGYRKVAHPVIGAALKSLLEADTHQAVRENESAHSKR